MDWYSYYKERFGWGHNPYQAVAACQRVVMELLNNHIVPMRIAADSAIGFLCALYDSAGSGYTAGFPFRIVKNALENSLEQTYDSVDAMDKAWAQEVAAAEREDSDGPVYMPPEYEVRDEDLDGEDTDGIDDWPTLLSNYGIYGEPGTTGTRTPFPDWEHISDWTQSDWIKLQVYKDKVLASAEHGFMAISSVSGSLSAAKEAMNHIPLPRQVELGMWAQEVTDALIVGMEDDLQKMLAGSLHSHEGRLVQKQLLSGTTEHPENTAI